MPAAAQFDDIIHPATRLSAMALLSASTWVDFAFIRDSLEVSDSTLSKQLAILEDARYVQLQKLGRGKTRKTRVQLTEVGRKAFEGHVAALRSIVGN